MAWKSVAEQKAESERIEEEMQKAPRTYTTEQLTDPEWVSRNIPRLSLGQYVTPDIELTTAQKRARRKGQPQVYYEVPATATGGEQATVGMTPEVYDKYKEALAEQDEQKRAEMMARLPKITPEEEMQIEQGDIPGATRRDTGEPFRYTLPESRPSAFVEYKTKEEHEAAAREEIRVSPPETLLDVIFAAPRPSVYYEETFGAAAPIVEFTSASMPAFVQTINPAAWFSGEQVDLSGMGFSYEVSKGITFAQEEPVKVTGYAAGFSMGLAVFGRGSGRIAGKLSKAPMEFNVKYWKGTVKSELGETPRTFDFMVETPGKVDVGIRTLDFKTVKSMTKYEKLVDFTVMESDLFRATKGRMVKNIFETRKVKGRPPKLPEFVDVLELGKPTKLSYEVAGDIGFGMKFESMRIPVRFDMDDPFKVKRFVGNARKGDVLREIFPRTYGKDVKPDFFPDLFLKDRWDFGRPGAPALITTTKPRPPRALEKWDVPIGVEEIYYPSAYPPSMMPKIADLDKPIMDVDILRKDTMMRAEPGIALLPKMKMEAILEFEPAVIEKTKLLLKADKMVRGRAAKIDIGFKPATIQRERQILKQEQILKQKQPVRYDFKPIDRFRGGGRPPPPIVTTFDIPDLQDPFRPKEKGKRRPTKKKDMFRKYRYAPSLGGRLFKKPIYKEPEFLTGLKMRPMLLVNPETPKKRKKKARK